MECFETKFAPVPVSTTPLPFPFRVFSPLKGLILCTQTSRVEGHHQVTPTRPPRICHFGVLPETWSFPDSARNLTLKFLGAIFHLLILQISWQKFLYIYIYIYTHETLGLLRDTQLCTCTRERLCFWNFHWNFYRFFFFFFGLFWICQTFYMQLE